MFLSGKEPTGKEPTMNTKTYYNNIEVRVISSDPDPRADVLVVEVANPDTSHFVSREDLTVVPVEPVTIANAMAAFASVAKAARS